MELTVRPIEVKSDSPFDNDLFDRSKEIESLTNLVRGIKPPFVIAIDSPWGSGKTTFVQMWKAHLQSSGTHSIYFNAWETDFLSDPLVAFLGEMDDQLNALGGTSPKAQKAWKNTKKIGGQIAKNSLPALVKLATAGALDLSEALEGEIAGVLDSVSSDLVEDYLAKKRAISDFKKTLSKSLFELDNADRLVVFVDELDRCRPDFAVSLLERIKHLFDIEQIVFVLSLDKNQLCESIKSIYGPGLDAQRYLRRFIDLEYSLVKPELASYVDHLFSTLDFAKFFSPRKNSMDFDFERANIRETFLVLATAYHLQLRDIEKYMVRLRVVLLATKEKEFIYPRLLIFLLFVRDNHPDEYKKFISDSGRVEEVIDILSGIRSEHVDPFKREFAVIEGYVIASKWDRFGTQPAQIGERETSIAAGEISESECQYQKTVVATACKFERSGRGVSLAHIVSKLDLVARIDVSSHNE